MSLNSRVLSLTLALVISIITTSFLGVFKDMNQSVVILVFIVSFVSTYLAIFLTLEFLVFREVKRINILLSRLKNKEYEKEEKKNPGLKNPIQNINSQISSFADSKQSEIEQLKTIAKFRKEFIENISHELKTPIFAAQGFVHTLLDGAIHDKQVRKKFLKKAAKSLDGLDVLVQDLLVLSQIETGDIQMNFEYFDLHKLVADIVDQFEHKAENKDISLSFESVGKDAEVRVYGDWRRIGQVLNNLISNAINYTNEGGEVKVVIEKQKNKYRVKVIDSGIGIPVEDSQRIFERFYRVDKSRSRVSGGTGLGLAIVKHILEGHGTVVELKSSPGKGSEFSFVLSSREE